MGMAMAMVMTGNGVHGWVPPRTTLAIATFPRTPHNNNSNCQTQSHRFSASTDEEGGDFDLSDADRNELVDALFKGSSSSSSSPNNKSNNSHNDDDGDDENNFLDKVDGFLDKPFFDPDAYDESDDSLLGKIARFVKADYELFEALFVACFFLLLITVAKDVLRAQMLAQGVVASGKLF
jgi:hypothetical protein